MDSIAENSRPIGVFDSGVGGLTVLRALRRALPAERFIYFGDTARVPYGAKSPETIAAYSLQIARFLQTHDVKLIVVACNSASACAPPRLRERLEIPILDVIQPGVERALATTRTDAVGCIATEGTIKSGVYRRLLLEARPGLTVLDQACPLFVPLAEEGWCEPGDPIARGIAARYLNQFKDGGGQPLIDTLILGCTHYPLLEGVIRDVLGDTVAQVDSAGACADAVAQTLQTRDLQAPAETPGGARFYVSDLSDRFVRIAERFLGAAPDHVEQVATWDLPAADGEDRP